MALNIKTIAKMAGVSVSTVSKIINNYSDVSETKARVLEIIERDRIHPFELRENISNQKSNLIGIIFAGKLNVDFTHPFC